MGPLASIDRRLLVAAAVLLAAIAAIPFLLKADPVEPPAPVPQAAAAGDAALQTAAVVTAAESGDRAGRRQVLGKPKNPFRPTRRKPKAAKVSVQTPPVTKQQPAAAQPAAPSKPATPVAPVAPPKVDKQSPAAYAIDVRVTQQDTERTKRDIPRLTALPSNSAPFLVYLGLLEDHDTAVFLVSSDVKVLTDGSCKPSTAQCERVHLQEGEIMYFEARRSGHVLQYELELLRIEKRDASSKSDDDGGKAKSARTARAAKAAKATQTRNRRFARWLVALQRDRLGGISYDAKRGVLRYPKRLR